MAIKLLAINDIYNIREVKYMVDEENEKDLIPDEDKVQGTKVLVIKGNKEYRMNSAGNWIEIAKSAGGGSTLPAVTADDNGDVLTVVDGEWGKGDAPYTVEEERAIAIPSQTVTTTENQGLNTAELSNIVVSEIEVEATYIVTYDGNEYTLVLGDDGVLGEMNGDSPDFSNYPFCIIPDMGLMATETVTTVTVKVEKVVITATPSYSFKSALVTSGAIGSYSAWNTQMSDIAFVEFEATDIYSADVWVVCSDGAMLGSIRIESDAETGNRTIVWGEWFNDDGNPVPNYTQYINTIQGNIVAEVGKYLETSNSPFGEPPSEPGEPGEPFGHPGYQIPFMIMRR